MRAPALTARFGGKLRQKASDGGELSPFILTASVYFDSFRQGRLTESVTRPRPSREACETRFTSLLMRGARLACALDLPVNLSSRQQNRHQFRAGMRGGAVCESVCAESMACRLKRLGAEYRSIRVIFLSLKSLNRRLVAMAGRLVTRRGIKLNESHKGCLGNFPASGSPVESAHDEYSPAVARRDKGLAITPRDSACRGSIPGPSTRETAGRPAVND